MTRTSATYVAGLVLAVMPVILAGAPAQGAQTPGSSGPPGAQAQPPKSTALILGQVTDGSSGQPIPEATVLLRPSSPGARGGGPPSAAAAAALASTMGGDPAIAGVMAAAMARGGAGVASRDQRLLTGSDGRFVFHSLPPGQYQLSVTLNGYTSSLGTVSSEPNPMMMFLAGGGRGVTSTPPPAYVLAEGEALTDVRLRLWKYASVTGTVFDDLGEPAVGLIVQAMRRTLIGGRARYAPAGAGRTDDRGTYRIGSLLPGDYLIVSLQSQMSLPATTLERLRDIGLAGRADLADQAETIALFQMMMTSGAANFGAALGNGVRLGGYMVAGDGGALPMLGADGRLAAFRTAFHADASTPVDATVLTLKSGDDRAGADFRLRLTPTVRVSGIVTGPDGPAAHVPVRLVVPGDRVVSDTEFDVAKSITTADGRFSFYGVPPGQFLLRAQIIQLPGAINAPTAPLPERGSFAAVTLPVGTTDIDDVGVHLSETLSVSGRVEFDGRGGTAVPSPKGAGIMVLPADGQTPNVLVSGRPTPVGPDGTFLKTGIVPGRYFLNVLGAPAPWQVRSATVGGRDVFDAPFEIQHGDLTGVVITLTDRLAQVSGTVTAADPYKPGDAMVILFPADYQAWIDGGMNPRLARTTRSSSQGAYTIPHLAAGDYLVVAIDRSDEGDLQDPAFIQLLAGTATRVRVTTEARTQALTVTRVRR